jgi:hypothetical protein
MRRGERIRAFNSSVGPVLLDRIDLIQLVVGSTATIATQNQNWERTGVPARAARVGWCSDQPKSYLSKPSDLGTQLFEPAFMS